LLNNEKITNHIIEKQNIKSLIIYIVFHFPFHPTPMRSLLALLMMEFDYLFGKIHPLPTYKKMHEEPNLQHLHKKVKVINLNRLYFNQFSIFKNVKEKQLT
jgi:hypothetical protein